MTQLRDIFFIASISFLNQRTRVSGIHDTYCVTSQPLVLPSIVERSAAEG
jgi:hypothetical protein